MSYDDWDDPATDEAEAQYNAVMIPGFTQDHFFTVGTTGTGKRRQYDYLFRTETRGQAMAMNQGKDPYRDGYQMGAALRIIAGTAEEPKAGIGPALRFLGLKFAEWEGYRETVNGLPYLNGFTDGFQGEPAGDQALLPPARSS